MEYDYKIQLVTDADFEEEVLKCELPVLVDFYSPGCAPCQGFEMVLVQLKEEIHSKVKVVKYNISQNGHFARQYGIRPTPTSVIFKLGSPMGNYVGSSSSDTIKAFIRESLPGVQLCSSI